MKCNYIRHIEQLLVLISCTMVRIYQKCISPLFPPSCRYYPTCSQYALQSLKKYGFFKGCFLTIKRILRCHPFHKGGYDPVP